MSSGDLAGILPLVLIVLAFWFLVIRPSRKRQQDMTRVQNSVEAGSRVMLGSGIYGTVVAVADDTVQLEVAPGTAIKVARQAVVRVVEDTVSERTAGDESPNVIDEQE
ncbi:MAG TPA: preprotein translocase subunit YajC [Nocardioidaceae bacterium]|nr:preprotein translocase subunit YajC [Nocardioidaceae bacterium]